MVVFGLGNWTTHDACGVKVCVCHCIDVCATVCCCKCACACAGMAHIRLSLCQCFAPLGSCQFSVFI